MTKHRNDGEACQKTLTDLMSTVKDVNYLGALSGHDLEHWLAKLRDLKKRQDKLTSNLTQLAADKNVFRRGLSILMTKKSIRAHQEMHILENQLKETNQRFKEEEKLLNEVMKDVAKISEELISHLTDCKKELDAAQEDRNPSRSVRNSPA